KPAPAATPAPGEAAADDSSMRISVPVPPGHDAKGLVIPYRDGAGKLQMRFTMEFGKRVDPDHMDMTQLLIETFDDQGKSEMSIDLPQSILNLATRIISTENGVTIKRSDFELEGQTMQFDTMTRQGHLGGKVHMLIYNLDDETNPNPASETAEKTGEK
ncbi:MAG TPA: LPS export ABC transporter periplasmic protein LptC, partial [Chthoniobacteraceae bacterium]|nr:LPS export ABC transporter periplasmic protein LptC [Chthoniobacteraceae bacterium]